MRKLYIFGLIVVACIFINQAFAEEFTMSTYYPAPFGVYREMRAMRMAIGDTYYDGGTYPWDEDGLPPAFGEEIHQDADLVVNGNVGIGTTNPAARLHIYDDTANSQDPDGKVQIDSGAYFNGQLRIKNVYNLDPEDETSIGFIGKDGRFWVLGAGASTGMVSDKFGIGYAEGDPDTDGAANFVTIKNDGKVGIGTTNPQGTGNSLDVTGMIYVGTWGTGGADVCTGSGDNAIAKCVSSIKYKEGIKDLDIGMEIVEKLKPVKFRWKETGEEDLGFIAEDVEQIDPILVTYREGEADYVKYKQLTTVLVNAIKEVKAENDELKQRVEALENK